EGFQLTTVSQPYITAPPLHEIVESATQPLPVVKAGDPPHPLSAAIAAASLSPAAPAGASAPSAPADSAPLWEQPAPALSAVPARLAPEVVQELPALAELADVADAEAWPSLGDADVAETDGSDADIASVAADTEEPRPRETLKLEAVILDPASSV